MTTKPFRFIAGMPAFRGSMEAWKADVRKAEDLGYSSLAVSDHLTGGWSMDPIVALATAMSVTERIRLLPLVLGNDYRHPAVLHRPIAMLDVMSGGRIELGLGAGWMAADYEAAGLPFDSAGTRIDRLAESVAVIKRLFADEPATLIGEHYQIHELDGVPKPVQRPHPPILLGGGGPRMLGLAAGEADIVGVHCRLPRGELDQEAVRDFVPARVDEKVSWVRDGLVAAGRDRSAVELQFTVYSFSLNPTGTPSSRGGSFAARLAQAGIEDSPTVVHGSVQQCEEQLLAMRERYGFSYLKLGADIDAAAPLVAKMAGT